MKFTICHDTSKKTLAIPRAALQLSGLEDAERLTLRAGHGCVVLTRQEGAARERLETIRLLHDLNVGMVVRLALDSRPSSGMPCKRASEVFRSYDAEFLDMLEHCGVDLFGLGALLAREEDAQ
ncbi:hypothetical protein RLF98_00815 [Flavonifractor plautii]|uniref:hypothetical protein n=1 Tax=Flavonifractor plautii TaxID=292800 RepID=UPI00189785B4|nr:hypothetical protein [Flavonifractor plautii]MDB7900818.1 hypothetical protein [Flavonifractor plautii]MDB7921828.1 hypothetical protein [Flavonifractor plautii]MDB7945734.1 hypothetical protein [Flavonifractor plautii]MDS9665031.1 hypothetical protein [Flavonifractor plautii]UBS60171.1 hypothetical protein LCR02_14925 [Flavonifractor plautii]